MHLNLLPGSYSFTNAINHTVEMDTELRNYNNNDLDINWYDVDVNIQQ